jgi:hypothetical protein
MVIEMLLNNDILKNCSNNFTLSNKLNVIMYITEFLKYTFESFHLDKISIKYEISKFIFL